MLTRTTALLTVIPLGIMLYRRPAFPFELRLIPYYISADVFLVFCDRLGKSYFRNNLPVFHFSTLFDITFIVFTYIRIFPVSRKNIVTTLWFIFLITWIISALTIDNMFEYLNTTSRIFGNTLAVVLSISHIMDTFSDNKKHGNRASASLIFSLFIFTYYSCSTTPILFQDLPRYNIFKSVFQPGPRFQLIALSPYIVVRLVQIALIVKMLVILPSHITPRKALPKWLRFRLGWRPPTEPPQYRVLPAHLVC